jgi:hypothetical protein
MNTEMFFEMLVGVPFNHLAQLVVWENFIAKYLNVKGMKLAKAAIT